MAHHETYLPQRYPVQSLVAAIKKELDAIEGTFLAPLPATATPTFIMNRLLNREFINLLGQVKRLEYTLQGTADFVDND